MRQGCFCVVATERIVTELKLNLTARMLDYHKKKTRLGDAMVWLTDYFATSETLFANEKACSTCSTHHIGEK